MKNVRWYWIALAFLAAVAVAPASCAKNNGGGGGVLPSGSPSASPSGSPAPCYTENPNSSGNLVVVDISSLIAASPTAQYGPIAGYGVGLGFGSAPPYASVIEQWFPSGGPTPSPKPITASNILQFTNVETSTIQHSAVGFTGNTFPSQPYTFPSPAASPTNTIIGSGFWSTGLIPAPGSGSGSVAQCFSQTFTLKPGTYYFGDLNFYNLTTFRDVLIVSNPAAARGGRRHVRNAAARAHSPPR